MQNYILKLSELNHNVIVAMVQWPETLNRPKRHLDQISTRKKIPGTENSGRTFFGINVSSVNILPTSVLKQS